MMLPAWVKITLMLCCFGLFREIRPSEPFVSEFLLGEWRNITEIQLNRDIYPLGIYFYLALLVFVFLVTDFLRFKPVIVLSGIGGISTYGILLWTSSLEWLQASQFFYGLFMATEIAYLTYIYAKVDTAKYPIVSSYTRIAALTGRFISGVSSQLLLHYGVMNYRDLNYITFTAQVLATAVALWLPSMQYGIYFHRKGSTSTAPIDKLPPNGVQQSFRSNLIEASTLIARHASSAYTRPKVLAWSLLYSCALALFLQVQTFIQLLWKQQQEKDETIAYNGAVEAAQTLFGAGGAYLASIMTGSSLPAVCGAIQTAAMLLATWGDVWMAYAGYIVTGMLFHYTITLASAKIASQLSDDSCFGLIFGVNTLIGAGVQTIMTIVLIQVLELSITAQYYCVSALYLLLTVGWGLGWGVHRCKYKQSADLESTSS